MPSPESNPPVSAQAFQEKLLTIDLIDALRREEQRLDDALGDHQRMLVLRDDIKGYYAKAGITVPEATIDQAIKERQEQRYAFRPPALGTLGRTIATLYVHRKLTTVAVLLIAAIGVGTGLTVGQRAQAERAQFQSAQHCLIDAEARAGAPDARALDALQAEGDALQRGAEPGALQTWVVHAERTCTFFTQPLELRVTTQRGEKTGVRRDFRGAAGRQVSGYYIIADVVSPSGTPALALVTDVEHNAVHDAGRVGVRTSDSQYEALKRDKQDDGLISERVIGTKPANSLQWQLADAYASDFIVEW